MADVVLDFSNLTVGGALQVASATIADLAAGATRTKHPWLDTLALETWISPDVHKHLTVDPISVPGRVLVRRTSPSVGALARPRRHRHGVRFTLFGPTYTGWVARREVMGFAAITMVYPELANPGPGRRARLRSAAERGIKSRLLRGADVYVVETPSLILPMAEVFGIRPGDVRVVPNRPHSAFLLRSPVGLRERPADGPLRLLYPTRMYPHKNFAILAPVATELSKAGVDVRFVVTLRAEEWARIPPTARPWFLNEGETTPDGMLGLYGRVDAVFFPSLLEASSATPLEANVMGVPLIASDREFVRETAVATQWFDPGDVVRAADAIQRFVETYDSSWRAAAAVAQKYRATLAGTSRTEEYLRIIEEQLSLVGLPPAV